MSTVNDVNWIYTLIPQLRLQLWLWWLQGLLPAQTAKDWPTACSKVPAPLSAGVEVCQELCNHGTQDSLPWRYDI